MQAAQLPNGRASSCKKISQQGRSPRSQRDASTINGRGKGEEKKKNKYAVRSVHLKHGCTQALGHCGHFPHRTGEQSSRRDSAASPERPEPLQSRPHLTPKQPCNAPSLPSQAHRQTGLLHHHAAHTPPAEGRPASAPHSRGKGAPAKNHLKSEFAPMQGVGPLFLCGKMPQQIDPESFS